MLAVAVAVFGLPLQAVLAEQVAAELVVQVALEDLQVQLTEAVVAVVQVVLVTLSLELAHQALVDLAWL